MEQWQVGPVPDYVYANSTHQSNDMQHQHPYQQPDMTRRGDQQRMEFPYPQPPNMQPQQQHHPAPVQPPMNVARQPSGPPSQQPTPTQTPSQPPRQRKRAAPGHAPAAAQAAQAPNAGTPAALATAAPVQPHPHQHQQHQHQAQQQHQHPHGQPPPQMAQPGQAPQVANQPHGAQPPQPHHHQGAQQPQQPQPGQQPATPQQAQQTQPSPAQGQAAAPEAGASPAQPPAKKSRTNTPWTPQEELRLKQMRDQGNSWAEIAKTFPSRTEGSVKKHWYKDMHYAEFAEDESQALMSAIKDYENNKWKVIGQKVGKPAKACEQYAKEHFPELFANSKSR